MPADVVAYAAVLGLLVIAAAVLFADPTRLVGRVRARRSASSVVLLGLPPGRPRHEREDYPPGVEGVYAIHAEMRLWSGIVAGLADLAEVAPLIEAAYLPSVVSR